jgi:CRP-like cAMP-binding protein
MSDTLRSEAHYDRLLAKLGSIADLTEDQEAAIRNLPARVRRLRAHEDIVMDGDRPTECCLLLEGFACRYKLLPDARRQILSFHIPGDIPDVQSLHLKRMDHSLAVLLPSRIALIPHASLRKLTHEHPALADIFWRDTLIDAAVFREWMVGMGRRSALARIAHLFCELIVRLRAVHLVRKDSITLRLTQAELGDALGLSTVHVNRVLQRLRGDGIIELHTGLLRVLDWPALMDIGEFSPDYLHLET